MKNCCRTTAKEVFIKLQNADIAGEDDYFVRIELEDYRKIKSEFLQEKR